MESLKMSQTPFELLGILQIGIVEFVSSNEIKIRLNIEAPEATALNAVNPRPFPRVNDYLIIPISDRFLVGQVEWIRIESSHILNRQSFKRYELVDLPYPIRQICLSPIGTLRKTQNNAIVFSRGADILPSIGAPVLLPTEEQLKSIVEIGENRRVFIGTSPLAGDAPVYIDPNRLFGRHLAVLGNTGSGKSCTVAGLIRWCLEEAQKKCESGIPNARFIILDPNGEYSNAFPKNDTQLKSRIFKVNPQTGEHRLKVPLWLWNSAEWCAFTQASSKTQRPALMHALGWVREGVTEFSHGRSHEMRRFLRTLVTIIRAEKYSGSPWGKFPKPKDFYQKLEKWLEGIKNDIHHFQGEEKEVLERLVEKIETLCQPRRCNHPHYDFKREEIDDLLLITSEAHQIFGGSENETFPFDVDVPRPFNSQSFLRALEGAAEMLNVIDYVEPMLVRIRGLLSDARMKPILEATPEMTLEKWLNDYIGQDNAENGYICIIDLSLVPADVIHIIVAVIARMIFESLQRYVKLYGTSLPTVLVMEEAHTFIRRYKTDKDFHDAASVCCQIFERIAREGRKFGLNLIISSQRPSELSPTVLSQCNTFVLHRISNDRDQEIVKRLVPDYNRGLLNELPTLPTQYAILLGWAVELPVLVRIRDLSKTQKPLSHDPNLWDVWIGIDKREVDWEKITNDWQKSCNTHDMNKIDA